MRDGSSLPDLLLRLTDARTVLQHTEAPYPTVDLRLTVGEVETLIAALASNEFDSVDWIVSGQSASYVPCPNHCGRLVADRINGRDVPLRMCFRCRVGAQDAAS